MPIERAGAQPRVRFCRDTMAAVPGLRGARAGGRRPGRGHDVHVPRALVLAGGGYTRLAGECARAFDAARPATVPGSPRRPRPRPSSCPGPIGTAAATPSTRTRRGRAAKKQRESSPVSVFCFSEPPIHTAWAFTRARRRTRHHPRARRRAPFLRNHHPPRIAATVHPTNRT